VSPNLHYCKKTRKMVEKAGNNDFWSKFSAKKIFFEKNFFFQKNFFFFEFGVNEMRKLESEWCKRLGNHVFSETFSYQSFLRKKIFFRKKIFCD
jgi:hypothetical protein